MATVYVWTSKSIQDPGHASLKIAGAYISFWPTAVGQVHAAVVSLPATRESLDDDCGPNGKNYRPEHVIEIHDGKLNEREILLWWNRAKVSLYSGLWRNCAHIVVEALRAGLNKNVTTQQLTGLHIVTMPGDVLKLALRIKEGT